MKKIVSMFLSLLLFLNFLTPGICAVAQSNQPGEGKVEVTNINVGNQSLSSGQRVNVNVDFKGGRNVKPGTKLTINLPQPTADKAGLYGINSTFNIDGRTADGKEVKDIATVHIEHNQAIVTFNQNVLKLPNGFTGYFTFSVEAQWAFDGTINKTQDVKIVVDGKSVTIHINPGTNTNPGTNPTTPISDNTVEKIGLDGKSGMINWQIQGTTMKNATGQVIINDTQNQTPGSTFLSNTFHLYITGANSGKKYQIGYTKLIQLGWLKVNGNTWMLSVPATVLRNTRWMIFYQCKPDSLQNGQVYTNHVSVTTDHKLKESKYELKIKDQGSGNIAGNEGSSSSSSSTTQPINSSSSSSSSSSTTQPTNSSSSSSSSSSTTQPTNSSSSSSSSSSTTQPINSSSSSSSSSSTTQPINSSSSSSSSSSTTQPINSSSNSSDSFAPVDTNSTPATSGSSENTGTTSTSDKPSQSTGNTSNTGTTSGRESGSQHRPNGTGSHFGNQSGNTEVVDTTVDDINQNARPNTGSVQEFDKDVLPQTGAQKERKLVLLGTSFLVAASGISYLWYRHKKQSRKAIIR